MKLIILKNNLKDGLIVAEKGINENTNLPILKNVLIKTYNNKIQISATNLELGISKLISGKIIEEGGLTIPFQTFYSIVNNINSDKINLETKNNNIIFKTDNYEAKLQGLSEDDYPIIPKIENSDKFIEFNTELFKEALGQVITSAQISEIRPEISGVLFDYQITIIKLVATDSFRLAEKTIYNNQYTSNIDKGFKIIEGLTGHGVGNEIHEDPVIYNFGKQGQGVKLKPGMVLASLRPAARPERTLIKSLMKS